jgi:hypothetical protein
MFQVNYRKFSKQGQLRFQNLANLVPYREIFRLDSSFTLQFDVAIKRLSVLERVCFFQSALDGHGIKSSGRLMSCLLILGPL